MKWTRVLLVLVVVLGFFARGSKSELDPDSGHDYNYNYNHTLVDYEDEPEEVHPEPWAYDVIWFQLEPEDAYVVKTKGGIATLTCRVASALKVYFKCNGRKVFKRKQLYHQFTHGNTGAPITQVQLNISREDIQLDSMPGIGTNNVIQSAAPAPSKGSSASAESFDYRCECIAENKRETKSSPIVHVRIAYLKKYFEQSPYTQHVEIDSQTELRCIPPEGEPHPSITWIHDGRIIERGNTNYIVTADGHLLIAQTKLSDMGNYSCIAENVASRRISEPALLTVYVHGGWSGWSDWTECQGSCGKGLERRNRACSNPIPLNGGRPCPGSAVQKQDCVITCPPIDGRWSAWTTWSLCGHNCQQVRRRSCSNPGPAFGGRNCSGKEAMSINCTGGLCKEDMDGLGLGTDLNNAHQEPSDSNSEPDSSSTSTSTRGQAKAIADTDIALYIGLGVAVTIFTIVSIIVMRLMRRKGGRGDGHLGMYDMAPNDYPLGYYPDPMTKKTQAGGAGATCDLVVHTSGSNSTSAYTCSTSSGGNTNSTIIHASGQLPLCYEYSYPGSTAAATGPGILQRGIGKGKDTILAFTTPDMSEHLYDVPQLPNHNILQQTSTLTNFSPAATASPSSDDNNSASQHNQRHGHLNNLESTFLLRPVMASASDHAYADNRKCNLGRRAGSSMERILPRSMSSSTTQSSDSSSFSSTDDSCSGPNSILYEIASSSSPAGSTEKSGALMGPEAGPDPDDIDPSFISWAAATPAAGCRLSLKQLSINLTIPEGSLHTPENVNVYCGLITKERSLPVLAAGQTLLSPIISCGPSSLILKKPAILSFHHCAALKYGGWKISLWHYNGKQKAWQNLVSVGEETIQTPVFIQLDTNQVFLVTDTLQRFALIGESAPSTAAAAVKTLRLAVFASSASSTSTPSTCTETTIRVHIMADIPSALERVLASEKRQSGRLLDKSRTLLFQDAGHPLCIGLEDIGSGWRLKSQPRNQEIPFNSIWSSHSPVLHSIILEKCERRLNPNPALCFRLVAFQNGPVHLQKQTFRIRTECSGGGGGVGSGGSNSSGRSNRNTCSPHHQPQPPRHHHITLSPKSSTVTMSSVGASAGTFNTTLDCAAATTPSPLHRLPLALRKRLCAGLDATSSSGKDWRLLAHKLNLDSYISWLGAKGSPTEHVLELWMERNRARSQALTDLLNALRGMDRPDIVAAFEKEVGPWI